MFQIPFHFHKNGNKFSIYIPKKNRAKSYNINKHLIFIVVNNKIEKNPISTKNSLWNFDTVRTVEFDDFLSWIENKGTNRI